MLSALKLSMRKNVYQMTNKIFAVRYCTNRQSESNPPHQNADVTLNKLKNYMDVRPHPQTAFVMIQTLANMAKKEHVTYDTLKSNEQFQLLNYWLKNALHEDTSNIIATLLNMDILKFPKDSMEVQILENALIKYNLTLDDCMTIFIFFLRREETENTKKILKKIREKIEPYSSKITDISKILFIYKNRTGFADSLLSSLDDIMQEKCKSLNSQTLISLVVTLAASQRRNPTLLYEATQVLSKNEDDVTPKQITNLFYALCQLNYYDINLMNKLADRFLGKIDNITNPTTVGAMLYSLKLSRFRHTILLDALSAWIERNVEMCRVQDLSSYLVTLAVVMYLPNNFDNLIKLVLPILKRDLKEDSPLWINCAWSLVVLNKADQSLIGSVLSKSVFDSLSKSGQSMSAGVCIKLLNINSVAKLMKDYDNHILDHDAVSKMLSEVKKKKPIHSLIGIKILESFLPSGKVVGNVLTPFGLTIGAEFILDGGKIPVLMEKYESEAQLPEASHRIAAMFWSFNHYCHLSQDLTGDSILAKDILRKNGYTILEIPYYELDKDMNIINNVKIVNNKIQQLY